MNRAFHRLSILLVILTLPASLAAQAAHKPADATHQAAPAAPSAEKVWSDLMAGNRRYVEGKPKPRAVVQLRHTLAKGQHPKAVVLTCSDSRVSPELLFDQTLGDLFVVRSAGNIADAIGRGSIEYAVDHLGAGTIVVLGHEKCGAVIAACSGDKVPSPNLQAILDQISPAVTKAKSYAQSDALVDSAIRENVHQSAADIVAHSEELQHAAKDGKLTIIEAVYKLDSGEVVRLSKPAGEDKAAKLDNQ